MAKPILIIRIPYSRLPGYTEGGEDKLQLIATSLQEKMRGYYILVIPEKRTRVKVECHNVFPYRYEAIEEIKNHIKGIKW